MLPGLWVVVSGFLVVVGLGEEWNTWSRFLALFIALCCICYGKWVASIINNNDTTNNLFFLCLPTYDAVSL